MLIGLTQQKKNLAASRRGQCVTNAGLIANILRAPRPAASGRGQSVTNAGWLSYILWAPRLEVLRQIKGNLAEQSVILSKPCESKDLRTFVTEAGQIGAKIPRRPSG